VEAPSEPSVYHRIGHDAAAIERLFVDSQTTVLQRIMLDLDSTDDPVHWEEEGTLFPRSQKRMLDTQIRGLEKAQGVNDTVSDSAERLRLADGAESK
jgi:hypothetical protein